MILEKYFELNLYYSPLVIEVRPIVRDNLKKL